MSVRVMGLVWDCNLPRNEKYILLAYADHADHDGGNVFPAVGRIAWKTGYEERMVQRITKKMIKKKILIREGVGPNGTNLYRIALDKLPLREPYQGGQNVTPQGGKMSPPEENDVQNVTPPPAKSHPQGGHFAGGGVTPSTPKPSFNRHQPSGIPSAVTPPDFKDLAKKALTIYSETSGLKLDKTQAAAITDLIKAGDFNLTRWISACTSTKLGGVKAENVQCRIDTYKAGGNYQNLISARRNGTPDPTPPKPAPIDDEKRAAFLALQAEHEAATAETAQRVADLMASGIKAAGVGIKKQIKPAKKRKDDL